ncbi:MAG: ABC transporter ATP-binding protein, partial [Mycoplasmataceae bacterium]|nr:ABC transporter ATP-binding protein [Mycoplasmataceae bacterium]
MIIDIKKDTKKDKKTLKQVVEFSTARYNRKDEVSAIELKNLRIDFGETLAVDNVSFKIKQGEMVTLLGPSGCGKTTTLNAITGLIQPTAGRIKFQGVDVTKTSPQKRKLGLVFQNYA